jgi:hypothetical protein
MATTTQPTPTVSPKLCECGCGELVTELATRTDNRQGKVRGQPVRFIRGHGRRKKYCLRGHLRPSNEVKNRHCEECTKERNDNYRQYLYNMSKEEYERRVQEQNNCCAICGDTFSENSKNLKPHVDHNHNCCEGDKSCGKCVRSLLCHRCNMLLAFCNDSIKTLEKAIEYLRRFSNGLSSAASAS